MKKIIIFGCQKITIDIIKFLQKKKVEIPLVITYPLPLDRIYGYPDIFSFCKKRNIKCITSNPDKKLLIRIGDKMMKIAKQKYKWHYIGQQYLDLIKKL